MQETHVQCLGGEDPQEDELGTYSSILAWKILWTEESGELQFIGVAKESDMAEHTHKYHS